MQDRAIFSAIDPLSVEHGIDLLSQSGCFREFDKQLQSFFRNPILGIVEKDSSRPNAETGTSF